MKLEQAPSLHNHLEGSCPNGSGLCRSPLALKIQNLLEKDDDSSVAAWELDAGPFENPLEEIPHASLEVFLHL